MSSAQYSLNVEQRGGAKHAGENNLFRVQLVKSGTIIGTIERSIPFDVPFPTTYVHHTTGIVVLSYVVDGFVEVYNSEGKKVWEQNFFKEMGPNYERTITVALGQSSIVFLTSDVTQPKAIVRKYSVDGAKQWETTLPFAMGYEVVMSEDEQTIAAGSYIFQDGLVYQSASIISNNGTLTGDVNILFRKAAFTDDNKYIAFTSGKEIAIVSVEKSSEMYHAGKITDGIITDLLWNGLHLIIQESALVTTPEGMFVYRDPLFIEYTRDLHEVRREAANNITFKTSSLRNTNFGIEFSAAGTTRKLFRDE
ncbi:MAG: hypothetical protein M0R68_03615 [Bacteroidetes bacterium]|nr:hypothetical protein [Bacteroidota bacterium]